jgi:hypothetical protein
VRAAAARRPPGRIAAVAIALSFLSLIGSATELPPAEGYGLVADLLSLAKKERRAAADRLIESGDTSLVPGIVDAIFFAPRTARAELYAALAGLTGAGHEGYHEWIEWVGAHDEIEPKQGYVEWKRILFSRIDEAYRQVFVPGAATRIRIEEIVSGGVPVAGIPALDDPPSLAGDEAGYLRRGERVFGVLVGGEARAYPLRILSWHELLNDVVGGEPITLSFCTLCGSGIVYSGRYGDGETLTFDTSGLLYRSNKLMLDRQRKVLWSNLTGEPVVGELAVDGPALEMLPATLTTWEDWLARHPRTRVLDLREIERTMDARHGFRYVPGAADRARSGVSFPVWLKSERLADDAEVYALRVGGVPKAYPIERLVREVVVNDRVGDVPLVLVAEPGSGAIRAFARGEREFVASTEVGRIVDDRGEAWRVGEAALESDDGEASLERIPGHVAFWFGWYAFYPQTEVYTGQRKSGATLSGDPSGQPATTPRPGRIGG